MDNKIGGAPRPTTTTGTGKTTAPADAEQAKKAAEEHPDAVSIGDVALGIIKDVGVNVLDPLGFMRQSKRVVDGAASLIDGTAGTEAAKALDKVKNLANVHAAIDQLRPGEDLEIGRKMEVEVEGLEGEGEVKIGVERDAEGYVVTLEQSGALGAGIGEHEGKGHGAASEGSVAGGGTGAVTFRVKTAEEAKALVDKSLIAMAAGTILPGADTVGLVATAIDDVAHVASVSVSVDATLAAELGFDLPSQDAYGSAGLKVDGEASGAFGITYEKGPPAVAWVEVEVAAEGGYTAETDPNRPSGRAVNGAHDVAEGTVKVRYAVAVGKDFDPGSLNTEAGQRAILQKAKQSGDVSVSFEGEVHVKGGHVITAEKSASGNGLGAALAAFAKADSAVEVHKERNEKLGGGIKPSDLAGGGVELAYKRRENVSPAEARKVTG